MSIKLNKKKFKKKKKAEEKKKVQKKRRRNKIKIYCNSILNSNVNQTQSKEINKKQNKTK
jgi:hypothetical protein